MSNVWGSDVPISMPSPPAKDQPGLQSVGVGFTMTAGGIFPDLDEASFEEYITPTYSPLELHEPEEV